MKARVMPASARGIVASGGYASGPLFLLDHATGAYVPSGDSGIEALRLKAALAAASDGIAALMATLEGEGADVLAFQLAMLEDDALAAPAFAAIEGGRHAAEAWTAVLDAEIAGYAGDDDVVFAARSSDLVDIRDRVLRGLRGAADSATPKGAILHGRDLTPSRFLATDWSAGGAIVLSGGSPASHVAMLARSRGIPMIVGLGALDATAEDFVLVDAEAGTVTVLPDNEQRHEFLRASAAWQQLAMLARSAAHKPAITADGTTIAVHVNITGPADVTHINIADCDGVGLMRTEFLFGGGLADEDTQYEAYRAVLEWAGTKPVVIRTLDAGGDKPVPGLTVAEGNPFLGLRGIRLSLHRPDVFRVQIRALLRASAHGNLKVMLPMVSVPAELLVARALFEEEAAALGLPVPPLGIMVEVPAVAIQPAPFADAAFFSIGSNDLTQYVMAAGRDSAAVARLADVHNPAVLSLIRAVAAFGRERGIPVSLCGDAGGDPHAIAALLHCGLRSLSVAPAQLGFVKAAIARANAYG
jgi:phosphotransferase system enzyme I (PtsI)